MNFRSTAAHSASAANATCRCKQCFTESSPATGATLRERSEETSPPRPSVAAMAVAAGGVNGGDGVSSCAAATSDAVVPQCPWCATLTLVARTLPRSAAITTGRCECDTSYPESSRPTVRTWIILKSSCDHENSFPSSLVVIGP